MANRRFGLGRLMGGSQKPGGTEQDDESDLGFGSSFGGVVRRMINRDGSFNIRREGVRLRDINAYVYLVTLGWGKLLLVVLGAYMIFNAVFALIYLGLGIETLSGGEAVEGWFNQFSYAFFFSAQTFTTVGYGAISPIGLLTNFVASIEAMIGLMGFAVATGVLWGRFSRPSAKIGFSKKGIIAPYQDINSFQFRMVNRRKNQLIELEVMVTLMYYKMVDGVRKQHFARLPLERDSVALFPLTWTVVHPIDRTSPLYNLSQEDLEMKYAEFLIIVKAYDDTFAQHVHLRTSYRYDELLFGAKFVKIFFDDEEGNIKLEMDKISHCERAELNSY